MYDTVFIAGSVDEEPQSLEKVIGHLHPPCPWGPLRPLSFLGTMWWVPGDRISCSGTRPVVGDATESGGEAAASLLLIHPSSWSKPIPCPQIPEAALPPGPQLFGPLYVKDCAYICVCPVPPSEDSVTTPR